MPKSEYFELSELDQMSWFDIVHSKLRENSTGLELAEKMILNSIEYRKDTFVVLKMKENGGFYFGKICCIVREDSQSPLFVLSLYSTEKFDQNSFCHQVKQIVPEEYEVCNFSELLDYHPLDGVPLDGLVHIRMKYLVFGESP